jgi:drug/metabolite transporter (DMT)-like permease
MQFAEYGGARVIYGLIAAAGWGLSTVAAAGAARQLGSYYAVLISQLLGLIGLGLLAAIKHPVLAPDVRPLAGLAAAGILGLLGWLSYYRALTTGPVGLVSAIGASYGGVTALLAITVLGERIGVIGGAGIVLATAGVALAAAKGHPPPGPPGDASPAPLREPALTSLARPATAAGSPPGPAHASTGLLESARPEPGLPGPGRPGPGVLGTELADAELPTVELWATDLRRRRAWLGQGSGLAAASRPRAGTPWRGMPGASALPARPRLVILRRAGVAWRAVQPVTPPDPPRRTRGARRRPRSRWRGTLPERTPPMSRYRRLFARPGTSLALGSAVVYGVSAFLLGRYSAREGWLAATLVTYAASVLTLAAALPFAGRRRGPWPGARGMAWAIVAGITEVIALLAFARGGQAGQVAVTAAVSSLSPALVLAAGFLVFRERLSARQLLGAACIIGGLVLLGLT